MIEVKIGQHVQFDDNKRFVITDRLGPFTFRVKDAHGLFYVLRVYQWQKFLTSEQQANDGLLIPMMDFGSKHQIVQTKASGILPLKLGNKRNYYEFHPDVNRHGIWEASKSSHDWFGPSVVTDAYYTDFRTFNNKAERRNIQLPAHEIKNQLLNIAYHLIALHLDGIVHLDIKPSRVLTDPTKGMILATPDKAQFVLDEFRYHIGYTLMSRWEIEASNYTSPEVIIYDGDDEDSKPTDEFTLEDKIRFDIFSFATLFYSLLNNGSTYVYQNADEWSKASLKHRELILQMRAQTPNYYNRSLAPAIKVLESEVYG